MEIQVTEELKDILEKSINEDFISAVISSPREKGDAVKIKVRPLRKKTKSCFSLKSSGIIRHFIKIWMQTRQSLIWNHR